jgi:hypothetical protein
MRFQRISAEDSERVFVVFKNVSTETMSPGYSTVWDTTTADGVRATKPATATLSLFNGVVRGGRGNKTSVQVNDFGEAQAYGFCANAQILNNTSAAGSPAAGDILVPTNAQWYLSRNAASDGKSGFVFSATAVATGTAIAVTSGVFIRAL